MREKQLTAPKDGVLPGYITDTVDSLAKDIEESKKRIEGNREEIAKAKTEIHAALNKAGIQLAPEQVDLLLDSVLSGDLVRLVAVFNSAKLIDGQLARLMTVSGENIGAARKYFAMHAALFALLVHAQDMLVGKIDKQYLPKLSAIEQDIRTARNKTAELLRAENREDQKRVLESNRESQKLADDAAKGYRRYLLQQREQIAKARQRATHDLQDRRQHVRDGGGELPAAQPDEGLRPRPSRRSRSSRRRPSTRSSRTRSCGASSRTSPASWTGPPANHACHPGLSIMLEHAFGMKLEPGPSVQFHQYFCRGSLARASSASMSSVLQLRVASWRL